MGFRKVTLTVGGGGGGRGDWGAVRRPPRSWSSEPLPPARGGEGVGKSGRSLLHRSLTNKTPSDSFIPSPFLASFPHQAPTSPISDTGPVPFPAALATPSTGKLEGVFLRDKLSSC